MSIFREVSALSHAVHASRIASERPLPLKNVRKLLRRIGQRLMTTHG